MAFFRDGKLYIDGSTLANKGKCRMLATLRNVHGFANADEKIDLKCGTAWHLAREVWWKTWSEEQAFAALDAFYKAWSAENVPDDHPKRWENVRDVLEGYMQRMPQGKLPFVVEPDLLEVGFCVPLDPAGHVMFYGRLDALVRGSDPVYYVLDDKTTKQINKQWGEQWKMSAQVTGYVWAARQQANLPVVGCIIQGIEVGELNHSTNKCPKHGVTYKECRLEEGHLNFTLVNVLRNEVQLEQWRRAAVAQAFEFWKMAATWPGVPQLPEVPLDGLFTGACFSYSRKCEFYEFCYNGCPAERVEDMYVRAPWQPFDPFAPGETKMLAPMGGQP